MDKPQQQSGIDALMDLGWGVDYRSWVDTKIVVDYAARKIYVSAATYLRLLAGPVPELKWLEG